jgi:hypothetical protein
VTPREPGKIIPSRGSDQKETQQGAGIGVADPDRLLPDQGMM